MPDTIPPSQREQEPTDSNQMLDEEMTVGTPERKQPIKIDWVAAQKFYMENPTKSYADVAKQFDISPKTVEVHGSREQWGKRREAIGRQTIALVSENIAVQNAEINERHKGMAQSMQRLVYEKMLIANRQIDKAKKAATNPDDLTVYDTGMISESKIKSLAEAMLIAVNLERVTANLPTAVERKEVTGRNGKDLFGDGDPTKLIELVADTIASLEPGAAPDLS